jgi:hypothetical protein
MAEQSNNTNTEGGTASDTATGGAAEDIRQKVASTVASAANTQKNRAADGLGNIADVARQTGEELRGQNEMLASWVNAASDQLRSIADRLRDRPAAELADDLASFARQRPALFIGGAFLLGLGVARLLKASPDRGHENRGYGNRGYGYPGMREYREAGMGGTLAGTGEGRSSGGWARDTGAY